MAVHNTIDGRITAGNESPTAHRRNVTFPSYALAVGYTVTYGPLPGNVNH